MRIILEQTDKIVSIDADGKSVPARIWEGRTEGGVSVVAFVTRLSPQTQDAEVLALFDRELERTRQPELEPWRGPIDLRLIL